MSTAPIPVLIAGGGPVGLALAIELGMAGIPCTLLERRDGSVSVPKMSGLSIRSMELNRRWGIAEKVKRAGWPQTRPHDFVYCTSMTGPELARFKVPSYADTHIPFTPEPGAVSCASTVMVLPEIVGVPHPPPYPPVGSGPISTRPRNSPPATSGVSVVWLALGKNGIGPSYVTLASVLVEATLRTPPAFCAAPAGMLASTVPLAARPLTSTV